MFFFFYFSVFSFFRSLIIIRGKDTHARARAHTHTQCLQCCNVFFSTYPNDRKIRLSDINERNVLRGNCDSFLFFFLFLFFSLPFFFVPATKRARLTRIKVFSLRRSINRIRFRRSPSRKKGSIFISAARSIAARKPIAFSISRNNYDTERINSSTSRLLHARNIVFSF